MQGYLLDSIYRQICMSSVERNWREWREGSQIREPPERNLIIGSQLLLTPLALQHCWYIGLRQPHERKKESLGCFCNQDVPKTEHHTGRLASRSPYGCREILRDFDSAAGNDEGSFLDRAFGKPNMWNSP
jgi:hypothetical protein